MKRFFKHTEIKTVKEGLYLKIEATPQDARKNDIANTFYIGYLIDRNVKGAAVYRSELRTFSGKDIRVLLGLEKNEHTYWD